MTKHTPGPWRIDVIDDADERLIYAPESDSAVIATVTAYPGEHEVTEEQHASAELIAAAPELLDALVLAYTAFQDYEHISQIDQNKIDALLERLGAS